MTTITKDMTIIIALFGAIILIYFVLKKAEYFMDYSQLSEDHYDPQFPYANSPHKSVHLDIRHTRDADLIPQSQGIPLPHESRPSHFPSGQRSVLYHSNSECRPECCKYGAPYSCDHGCVCWTPPPERLRSGRNSLITPS
jgi:hypothetical protein